MYTIKTETADGDVPSHHDRHESCIIVSSPFFYSHSLERLHYDLFYYTNTTSITTSTDRPKYIYICIMYVERDEYIYIYI